MFGAAQNKQYSVACSDVNKQFSNMNTICYWCNYQTNENIAINKVLHRP